MYRQFLLGSMCTMAVPIPILARASIQRLSNDRHRREPGSYRSAFPGPYLPLYALTSTETTWQRCSAYGLSAAVSMLTTSGASFPIAAPKAVMTRGRQITAGMTSLSGPSRHPGDGALPSEMRIR